MNRALPQGGQPARQALAAIALIGAGLIGSCQDGTPPQAQDSSQAAPQDSNASVDHEAGRAAGEALARRFYDIQRSGEFDRLDSLYSRSYLEARSGAGLRGFIGAVAQRLGTVKEITLESWNPAGTGYDLVYQVIRTRHVARETLTTGLDSDSFRIRNYKVESDGIVIPATTAADTFSKP